LRDRSKVVLEAVWENLGVDMRILLTPRIWVEHEGGTLDDADLPGRQGRVAFAFLVLERHHPTARDALADALWPGELPSSWETSMSAVVSKLRSYLSRAGLDGAQAITSAVGCYQLRVPAGTFVDIEAAVEAVHTTESLARDGNHGDAWGFSQVAYYISRRPFLPGAEGPWVERVRAKLRDTFMRTVDVRSEICLTNDEPEIAIGMAGEALEIDPYRESAHRILIRGHVANGNRVEAIRAYDRCCELFSRDLGVEVSPETTALIDAVRTR
jgi:DNA-binding SARP family transcriptional activator